VEVDPGHGEAHVDNENFNVRGAGVELLDHVVALVLGMRGADGANANMNGGNRENSLNLERK
jgi:hypothetical protein